MLVYRQHIEGHRNEQENHYHPQGDGVFGINFKEQSQGRLYVDTMQGCVSVGTEDPRVWTDILVDLTADDLRHLSYIFELAAQDREERERNHCHDDVSVALAAYEKLSQAQKQLFHWRRSRMY